ncbi:hypothetical protein [Edaphobacter sp.]|uniref:hypothetical protein n=1 Tax=Edaphobacter sp. TaxID=1934404 RepID=UPI002DBC334F|nr:hypothetical protein [Edaphobacter sp.]HEU5340462.1 hypothetical protein [Edaphobacter sp.]
MEVSRIINEIDAQIAKLQQARALLLGTTGRTPGRPKGSKNSTAPRKRRLSAAGRKRISEAMKKRWEEQRKKGAKKS